MDLNNKVTQLEDEIKILKNEVQAVLLDLRESFLNNVNPFHPNTFSIPAQSRTVEPQSTDNANASSLSEQHESGEEDGLQGTDIAEDEVELNESEVSNVNDNLGNDELFDGPNVSFMPASNGDTNTIPKDQNMGWDSVNNISAAVKPNESTAMNVNKLDLTMIENLSGWVEETVTRLGHERTRIILDVTETMGYIMPELKNILVKFIHPISDDGETIKSKQDYLTSLIELNNLLGTENRMEVALLYILCQEYENR